MSEWTRSFAEVGAGDVALVGGKAANLGEMTRAGLPVPPGFCVTADAYRRFIETAGAWLEIERRLASVDPAEPATAEAASAAIRDLLTASEMPAPIASEIGAAYSAMFEGVPTGGVRPDSPVAVRSSATAEDMPDASFAGQQDTYLYVRGSRSVIEHVQRCWASLWTARAVLYRQRHGYDHRQVALAVAVQAMIGADVAGVMFTADPVTSDRDAIVVNASWGLGEAIVSGIVTPDTWTIAKSDGRTADRVIGHKERQVVRSREGGTVEQPVPAYLRDVPSLTDDQLAELAAIGRRIEDHYGAAMDVEWAYAGGRCFVLQARPITTLSESPATPAPPGDFNRTMFLEIFPDPLSPAFVSVVEPLFGGMLDFTFRTLGFRPPTGIQAVGTFYDQPYFNERYIEAALAPLRPKTRRALVAQIVNPFGRQSRDAAVEVSVPFARMGWRLLRLMRSLHRLLPQEVDRYRAAIAELDSLDLKAMSDTEILERVDRLVFRSAHRLLDYDFLLIALVGLTYQALGSLLEPYFGDETEELRARLVSGVTGNVTMETNKRLWDLARQAGASEAVSAAVRATNSVEELHAGLAGTPDGDGFLAALDGFLVEYGHREIRMDILYPTWIEDPAPVLGFVRGYLDVAEASSPHVQEERLARERVELADRVRGGVRRNLRGRLVVWPVFRWVLGHTQANTRHRDTMHFELTRLFPPFRALLLELGRKWTAGGLIDEPDDVFFLTLDEMKQIASAPMAVHDRVARGRRELEANRRRMPPPIIRDGTEVWSVTEAEAGSEGAAGAGESRGIAGSPGRASGVVRVVRGPEEFDKLADGEILVAPLTNPVWTPLFAIAGGLVTEVGGILSHGAIVAREYGIPAVMAVAGATTNLRDGDRVTVDGGRGIVVVEPASAATDGATEAAPVAEPA